MKLKNSHWIVFSCALLLVTADLQANDEAARKALAKAQYMLRQATAEKTALQKNLTEAKGSITELEGEKEELESDLSRANKKIDKLNDTLALWKDEYQKLKDRLRDTRMDLANANRYGSTQTDRLDLQSQNFELCLANNEKLFDLNKELIGLYEGKSVVDAIKQREPFTGMKQVEIENLVQDYQYKNADLNLEENQHMVEDIGASPEKPVPVSQ